MSEIIFIYKGYEIPIKCSKGEKLKNIIERLSNKINIQKKDIYGLYSGKILDEEIKEDEIPKDENNKKVILIYEYDKSTIINNMIKSNEIICPECKENCLIKIKDYQILLYNCKNKHENTILLNEYDETQEINISNIAGSLHVGHIMKGAVIKLSFTGSISLSMTIIVIAFLSLSNEFIDSIRVESQSNVSPE